MDAYGIKEIVIEFDTGAEYNGQGLIANTWPEHILERAKDLLRRPHVTGYVAYPYPVTIGGGFTTIRRIDRGFCKQGEPVF